MDVLIVALCLAGVTTLYFLNNPLKHSREFMWRRFLSWFPLGMTYAFLYMARYNLNIAKNALGDTMSKEEFGIIFGVGTAVYGLSFLINGPLVDRLGGKRGILLAAGGASFMNILLGAATYLYLNGLVRGHMTVVFAVLYALNMFFQSYGAVSIIKIKAYWFHVRERGLFGAIFGTLISFGVYFAFDWGQAIVDASKRHSTAPLSGFESMVRTLFAVDVSAVDATWLVFFIPALILIFWCGIDYWLIKATPVDAQFDEFDPHDASSDEEARDYSTRELLSKIFNSPVMRCIALVEFTSGVLRNGILQWYFIFAKEVPQPGASFFLEHWGMLLCITGIGGGFAAGIISDRYFHSRRGPPAAIMNFIMIGFLVLMASVLFSSPFWVGVCAVVVSFSVIGVHSMMSGSAAADFGGRRATATASGIVDGCVYLGSGLQSVVLGYLTTRSWAYWPLFLAPFAVLGLFFSLRMWTRLPDATKRYLTRVERVSSNFLLLKNQ